MIEYTMPNPLAGGVNDAKAWHFDPNTGDNAGASGRLYNNAGSLRVGDNATDTSIEGDDVSVNAVTEITLNTNSLKINGLPSATQTDTLYIDGSNNISRGAAASLPNAVLSGGNPSVDKLTYGSNGLDATTSFWARDVHKFCFGDPSIGDQHKLLSLAVRRDGTGAGGYFAIGIEVPDNTEPPLTAIKANEIDDLLFSNLRHNEFKNGVNYAFNAGYANSIFPTPTTYKGGSIVFQSGGNLRQYTAPWPNIDSWGDIRFVASPDRVYLMDSTRKVLRVDISNYVGATAYKSSCTDINDIPNIDYIKSNFSPISSSLSKLFLYFESNAISTGGGSSTIDNIKGVLLPNIINDFIFDGNNKITYNVATTKTFIVSYGFTVAPDSLDRSLEVFFVINATANQNPPQSAAAGSMSFYNAQSQVNYTLSVSKTFTVSLAQNDTLQPFLTNTLNSNNTTVRDFFVNIRED